MNEHRDKYYYRAKRERFNSRAAYKLLEIQDKFDLMHRGDFILEVGSSPGGWTQVITGITGTDVFCIDRNSMKKVPGSIFIRGDINNASTLSELKEIISSHGILKFDGILSDAMSPTTGNAGIDHSSSYLICESVMSLTRNFLRRGGYTVVKQFQGDLTQKFFSEWSKHFLFSKITTVSATRRGSREVYIIFKQFTPQYSPL
jgi:23S rRNA (uridine2552-2'-O)-methyltransferase